MDKPIIPGQKICNVEDKDIERLQVLEARNTAIQKTLRLLLDEKTKIEHESKQIWDYLRKKYLLDDVSNYQIRFDTKDLTKI
jgi:hypothetical protein